MSDSRDPDENGGLRARLGVTPVLEILAWLLIVAGLFFEVLFGGQVFFYRDIHAYWYPLITEFISAVGSGEWPLWSPHVGFGEPLLANPAMQLLYPMTWLSLLLQPPGYYTLFVVVHLVVGALGTATLARGWGLSRGSGFLAGVVWCSCGPILSAVSLWHHFAGAAWVPWVLWAFERVLRAPDPRRGLILGAIAAGQSLAGSADMCVMSGLACLGRVALALPARRSLVGLSKATLVAALFAFGIAAAQWLPALKALANSPRAALDSSANTYWSLHPWRAFELFIPTVLGAMPLEASTRQMLFEGREPFLTALYLGAGTLPLVASLFLFAGRLGLARQRRGLTIALAFLGLCALGRHTPLYSLLLQFPPIALLRYPVKFMLPAAVIWSVLVGFGFETWRRRWSEREMSRAGGLAAALLAAAMLGLVAPLVLGPRASEWFLPAEAAEAVSRLSWSVWTAAAVLLVGAGLTWYRSRRSEASPVLPSAAALLVLVDLLVMGRGINPLAPEALMTHRPPLLDDLRAASGPHRLYVAPSSVESARRQFQAGPRGWTPESRWALGSLEMLRPPTGARFGLDGSYHGDWTGLMPRREGRLAALLSQHVSDSRGLRLLQLGGVTHVMSMEGDVFPGVTEAASAQSVFASPLRLLRVPKPLPRAFAVNGVRASEPTAEIDALMDPGFDPGVSVILTGGVARPPSEDFRSRVRIVHRGATRVSLEVELSHAGFVVLLEAYDEGWMATVDDVRADVWRANVLFRGVAVPAGPHVIEMQYRPAAWNWGFGLTALTLAFGVVAGAIRPRQA